MKNFNFKFFTLTLAFLFASAVLLTGCTGEEEEDVSLDDTLVSIGDEVKPEPVEEEVEDEVEEVVEEIEEEVEEEEEKPKETIDMTDGQNLDGATSADGARITSYSYGTKGNIFEFTWTVKGSSSKPIPQVQAKHNADGDIVVVFPDLESDYIARDSKELELGGLVDMITWNRTGNESMYKFDLKSKKDFELKSSVDDSEIILEIKLY